jgi:hypothetical protein
MTDLEKLKFRAANGTKDEQIDAYLKLSRFFDGAQGAAEPLLQLLYAVEAAKRGSVEGVTLSIKILSQNAKGAQKFTDKCEYLGQMMKGFPIADMEAMGCDEALAIAGTAYEDMAVTLRDMAGRASAKAQGQYVEASIGYLLQAHDAYTAGELRAKSISILTFCTERAGAIDGQLGEVAVVIMEQGADLEAVAVQATKFNDLERANKPAREAHRLYTLVAERFAGIKSAEESVARAEAGCERLLEQCPFLAPQTEPARSEPPRAGQKPSRNPG